MKSTSEDRVINCAYLHSRLIRSVNARIRNGEFTERGLARLVGVSQTQIHNVLKGARKLSPALVDQLLWKFGMSLIDLLDDADLIEAMVSRRLLTPGDPSVTPTLKEYP